MADFQVSGLDELIHRLESMELFDEEFQRELLFDGADIMTSAVKSGMSVHGTGEMVKKIGYTKTVKLTKSGARRVTVTAKGRHRESKQRYATIAFVLNYGRSERFGRIPASYAWTKARLTAEPRIAERWERAVTERLKMKGLV